MADTRTRSAWLGSPAVIHALVAAGLGEDEISRLASSGADVNFRTIPGRARTPLHWMARFATEPKAVARLIELGADPAMEDKLNFQRTQKGNPCLSG